jgi:hypothetical protein
MSKLSHSLKKITLVLLALAFMLAACDDLKDPLKDKETGDDINLLIVDFNFFRTHLTVNLYDAVSHKRIEVPSSVTFTGKNGTDIVTYTGNKKSSFEILKGQLELTVDPNIKVSEAAPLNFGVTVDAEGYTAMSKTETFLTEGKKSVDIFLARESDQTGIQIGGEVETGNGDTTIIFSFAGNSRLKSASSEKPFSIKYELTLNDFLKLKDESGNLLFTSSQAFWDAYNARKENFLFIQVNSFNDYPSWPDVLKKDGKSENIILRILETGTLEYMSVDGKKVGSFNGAMMKAVCEWNTIPEPLTWGYAVYDKDGWLFRGKETIVTSLPYSYTIIQASDEVFCTTGASLRFEAGFKSSFSIMADVYDMKGALLFTRSFSGNFPAEFVLENVPGVPAKLVFRNNNPSFKPIPDLNISSLCSGNYMIAVQPQDGFIGYQIVLKGFCPDNPTIAVAPSYSGEYRFAGTSGAWQSGFMQGGVLDLLGKPDQAYEYRLLWENEWETTSFTTTFNSDGTYPFTSDSKITSEKLSDGRIRINVSHTFRQNVCDKMNW